MSLKHISQNSNNLYKSPSEELIILYVTRKISYFLSITICLLRKGNCFRESTVSLGKKECDKEFILRIKVSLMMKILQFIPLMKHLYDYMM